MSKATERLLWAALSSLLAFKSVDLSIEHDKVQIKLQRAEAQQQESNFGLAGLECANTP